MNFRPSHLARALNYNRVFYEVQAVRSGVSAREVVAQVSEFVNPSSVVDVGCGVAAWLEAWKSVGVARVLGIDGPWVKLNQLRISEKEFFVHDLTMPLKTKSTFDLVMSLEVGEHLGRGSTNDYLDLLVSLGPKILFSAAIPQQGGSHHVNERWQGEWARDFAKRGYVAIDAIRPLIWNNPKVQVWYRQNIILYVKKECVDADPKLRAARAATRDEMLSLVHPDIYRTELLKGFSGYVRQLRGISVSSFAKAWRSTRLPLP